MINKQTKVINSTFGTLVDKSLFDPTGETTLNKQTPLYG